MWDDCEGIGRLRDGREVLRTKEGTRHARGRKMIVKLQAAFVREYATDFCAKGAVTELPPVQGDCIGGPAQLPSQSAEWLLPLIIALYDYRHLRSGLMYNFLGFM